MGIPGADAGGHAGGGPTGPRPLSGARRGLVPARELNSPTPAGRHAAVVGGGVFGTSAALELRRRGWRVTVFDPGPLPHPDASSTDVSKLVRMDYGSDVLYHELAELALEGWDRWNADWPRALYHEEGILVLSKETMAPGGFEHESFRVLRERGHRPHRLEEGDLGGRFPVWRAGSYADGYLNDRAGWVESGAVVARLSSLCAEAGVDMRAARVESLRSRGSRVAGLDLEGGESVAGERVVLCAGAWTPSLVPWLADRLRATAQSVVHFAVEDPGPFRGRAFPPWTADIAGSGWYGFPALPDGRVKVCNHGPGTDVDPRRRGAVPESHVARTRAFLRYALPRLAEAPVIHRRVCLYCDAFDGDFLIGRDPSLEGLVVAAGGSGHAFKFAPVLGGLVADAVEGETNRWSSRFAWRAAGAPRTEEARHHGR